MNNIENELNKTKKELDNLKVPDELESRLRQALDNIPNKKNRFNHKGIIAAVAIAIFLIAYNVDTIADYGKKLIGYDKVMNRTLSELNRLGKGQIIDKSHTFEDGNTITLDGIMLDDYNLVVFYSIYNPNASGEDLFNAPSINISGTRGEYSGGGQGDLSRDGKEIKWVMTYDAPKFYEKDLKMTFINNNGLVDGEINFQIDRSKAMGKDLKINIGKEIKVLNRKVKVKSLVASPISTIVKGEFQNIFELGLGQIKGERVGFESIEIELLANGELVNLKSTDITTNLKGSYFDIKFDALPKNTEKVEVKLKSLSTNESVNEKISLAKDEIEKTINILDQTVVIDRVYEEDGNTYIDITTDDEVYLSSLYLKMDGKKVDLERSFEGDYDKETVNIDSAKFIRTRTLEFKGTGEKLELLIKKLRYIKHFDKTIYKEKVK